MSQASLFASGPASVPLRPYQQRAVDATRQAYREGARTILLVSPTGSGKTRIAAEFVTGARRSAVGGDVLWLAHRAELLTQARDRLMAEGVPRVGIIAPWAEPDAGAPVQVASIQTLVVRLKSHGVSALPRARVVVVDEAHHVAADTYREVAGYYQGSVRLGLTATPERGDGRPMGDMFERLIVVASVRELMDAGHLVPCHTIAPSSSRKDLAEDPLRAYLDRVPGERAFVFCSGVAQAVELAERFEGAGVRSAVIAGKTTEEDRARILEAFRAGRILALCNVFVLTEGVDVPEASACILARGCDATGTYIQMVGRVLRPAPGKVRATLIDLRGVVHDHGLPDADRVYSLEGKAISTAEKKPTIVVCKRCEGAFAQWRIEPGGGRCCPECGAPAPPPKRPKISREQLNSILIATPVDKKRQAYERLVAEGRARGWKPAAAKVRYKAIYGEWPRW